MENAFSLDVLALSLEDISDYVPQNLQELVTHKCGDEDFAPGSLSQ